MKNLNEEEFGQFISSNDKVLIEFFADWCGPCKVMLPILERAHDKLPGRVGKLNIEECPDITAKFGIKSIPTVIVFQNNMVVDKKVGMIKNENEIFQMLS